MYFPFQNIGTAGIESLVDGGLQALLDKIGGDGGDGGEETGSDYDYEY